MFCTKCGAKNSDEAVFCQKCGARLEMDDEETRIARSPAKIKEDAPTDEPEKQIFSLRPTLLFVKIGYAAAVAAAFLLVAVLFQLESWFGIRVPWWFSVLAGFSLVLIPAYSHLKRNTVRYTLTDAKVEISDGFVSHNTRNIPLWTIQDVSVSATVFQRLLGFGDLVIENANDTGGRIVLKNVDSPKRHADVLLKQMRRLDR